MKIYAVGGAIRDALLGQAVKDRDYVVVGATPEQMAAQGYRPVGRDFPVFLHPRTHEEYALARTERKIAAGYHGFQFFYAPDVTLEEDLARRDLTINAMAREVRPDGSLSGPVIDPFDGQADLAARVFRHVGSAFAEDPVRILRVARFAARFDEFTVAPETLALMRAMVRAGEVDALVPERVWQEMARGLMECTPSRMFTLLREAGALARLLPELDALYGMPRPAAGRAGGDAGAHAMRVLDHAAARGYALPVRFAALACDLGRQGGAAATAADASAPRASDSKQGDSALLTAVCECLKVPNDCRDLALLVVREQARICAALTLSAAELVELFERSDALRKPARFAEALQACEAQAEAELGLGSAAAATAIPAYPQADRLREALLAARAVDAGAVAAQYAGAPEKIRAAVHAARVAAVAAILPRTAP